MSNEKKQQPGQSIPLEVFLRYLKPETIARCFRDIADPSSVDRSNLTWRQIRDTIVEFTGEAAATTWDEEDKRLFRRALRRAPIC